MDPFTIAAIGVPAIGSFLGQSSANRTNVRLAREQMAFQERMSGSAYQRAVQDMRLAGLNPALAYQQGGAQSPGGSITQVEDAIGPAVSSAQGARRLRSELDLLRVQALNTQEDTQGKIADRQLTGQLTRESVQRRMQMREDLKRKILENEVLELQIPGFRAQSRFQSGWFGRNIAPYTQSIFGGGILRPFSTR